MDVTEVSTTDKILLGVQIIRKYQPDAEFATGHDVIYFGDGGGELMEEEDLDQLDQLGWFEEYESWARFV